MHPTTIIDLTLLVGFIIGNCLIALLLPKNVKKIIWVLSCTILLIGITFYSVRPFIVQYQTNKAIDVLENHLRVIYTDDSWRITDTDENEIESIVYLHVIFKSEPKLVYEYAVQKTTLDQVGMWMLSGHSIEESNIEPQHKE